MKTNKQLKIMTKNKEIPFVQVTCIERLDDNKSIFDYFIRLIELGYANKVVEEMNTWPKSDLEAVTYGALLRYEKECDESIVYDDSNYILTANEDIVVLYQRTN